MIRIDQGSSLRGVTIVLLRKPAGLTLDLHKQGSGSIN